MEIKTKRLHLHILPIFIIVAVFLGVGIGVMSQAIDPRILKDGLTSFSSPADQDDKTYKAGNDAAKYLED